MRLCRLPLVLAGVLVTAGYLGAQAGPKKESGDTVARPKRRATPKTPRNRRKPKAPRSSRIQKRRPGAGKADGPTFRSDNLTVTVDVGVLDNRGRFIPNIPARQLQHLERRRYRETNSFSMARRPSRLRWWLKRQTSSSRTGPTAGKENTSGLLGFLSTLKPSDIVAGILDLRSELSDFSTNRQDTQE
ncbi:MAG: hypothetical protein IPP47_22490 [Bryobacterales bacterium]|nr:hypothetical protein [Bryobacterales bacterium]